MIDHLVQFPDEATAQADPVVGAYWLPPQPARGQEPAFNGAWRPDVCFPCQVYTVTGTQTVTRTMPDNSTMTFDQDVRAYSTDFYLWICSAQPDPNLDAASILVRDRFAEKSDQPHIMKSSVALADLPAMRIEPCILGSDYPTTPDDWEAIPDVAAVATADVVALDVSAQPLLAAVAMPKGTKLQAIAIGAAVPIGPVVLNG